MNDNELLMYDYLMQMQGMSPELEKLKRQQSMVDTLRGAQMGAGQMVSGHYVPKGLAGAISTLGQNYMGAQMQKQVDRGYSNPDYNPANPQSAENMPGYSQKQAQALRDMRARIEEERKRRAGQTGMPNANPPGLEYNPYAPE